VKRGGLGFLINMKQDESGPIAMTENEKKEILQQHYGKYGVGKNQMPYGLSDIPLAFVRTNLTIAELQPFEETLADAISISGAYGIPAVLVPRKDQATFSNQSTAEKGEVHLHNRQEAPNNLNNNAIFLHLRNYQTLQHV
jgi:hypothetical protein